MERAGIKSGLNNSATTERASMAKTFGIRHDVITFDMNAAALGRKRTFSEYS